ncbi:hypothetical protein V1508DRAFT_441176 [Lipomyces doorenjongii]|uniref:uncharacterized protein n=1 Tax=Lipomyces doorenjongii TaxID=383834 RepID=UPI0034CE6FAA
MAPKDRQMPAFLYRDRLTLRSLLLRDELDSDTELPTVADMMAAGGRGSTFAKAVSSSAASAASLVSSAAETPAPRSRVFYTEEHKLAIFNLQSIPRRVYAWEPDEALPNDRQSISTRRTVFSECPNDKHARRADQDLTLMVRDKMLYGKRTADEGQSDGSDAEQITSGMDVPNRPRKRSRRANAPIAIDIGMDSASTNIVGAFDRLAAVIATPPVSADSDRLSKIEETIQQFESRFDSIDSALKVLLEKINALIIYSFEFILGAYDCG